MARPFRLIDSLLRWRRRPRPGTPRGVLLVAAGGLGDTVLFAVVLPRFLALAEPGEPVTVLLRRDAAKMGFLFPPEVTVESVDFARLARDLRYRAVTFDALHRANYRRVVSVDQRRHPYLDEALVAACDAAETLAMEARPWAKYDAALMRNRRLYDRLHASGGAHVDKVVRWSRFADWLSGVEAPPPRVRLPGDVLPAAAALPAPTVFVQPFSAVPEKQSPPDLYRAIFDQVPADWRIVLTGAPADLERHPAYRDLLDPPRVDFDGALFRDLLPRLRAARLVVTVDTGLMHLAVAAGVPTLCLASAAYVGEIVPYADEVTPANVRFAWTPMPCEGCLGTCVLPAEDGMFPCVARLDREAVLDEVRRLVDKTAQR